SRSVPSPSCRRFAERPCIRSPAGRQGLSPWRADASPGPAAGATNGSLLPVSVLRKHGWLPQQTNQLTRTIPLSLCARPPPMLPQSTIQSSLPPTLPLPSPEITERAGSVAVVAGREGDAGENEGSDGRDATSNVRSNGRVWEPKRFP